MKPTPSSEFPHANPLLSSGTVWLSSLSGESRPRRFALATWQSIAEPAATPPPEEEEAGPNQPPDADLEPCVGASTEPALLEPETPESSSTVDHPPSDAFDMYCRALVTTLLSAGATRSASVLQQWLQTGHLDATGLDEGVRRCLAAAGHLEESARGDQPTQSTRDTLQAWRAVLSRGTADLSACGERTLDEWSAGLVTALLGRSERETGEIRRSLRRAGIAAFGVIEQAA